MNHNGTGQHSPASGSAGEYAGHVAVITGASSGVGRAAALDFARAGATVVAVARNERGLQTLAEETETMPGSVLPRAADVTDPALMRVVAEETVDRYGRLDTWANVAALFLIAPVEDTTADDLRRLMDVNVLGVLNGMHAALPPMRRQGSGTIINVGSIESWRALPLQGGYAASKHAIRALTDAFRVELRREGVPVDVCLVTPSSINTPLWQHARVRTGARPQPPPPVYEPEAVARAIVRLAKHPVDRVAVGLGGKVFEMTERLAPGLADRFLESPYGFEAQQQDAPDDGIDNFDAPFDEHGATRGSFSAGAQERSWYTDLVALHPVRTRLVGLGAAAVAGALVLRRR